MSLSVKTIFKVLIGTSVLLVVGCLLTEIFNLSVAGMQLKQACGMAANQAAELYTQETYKVRNDKSGGSGLAAFSANLNNINAPDGTLYVTGQFYDGTDTASIWNDLYSGNPNFNSFCNLTEGSTVPMYSTINGRTYATRYTLKDTNAMDKSISTIQNNEFEGYASTPLSGRNGKAIKNAFTQLNRLYVGVTTPGTLSNAHFTDPISYTEFSTNADRLYAVNAAQSALRMKSEYYTPVNIGIPYFDPETINKMFRWNATQLLTNMMPATMQQDESGNWFVNYKGFRCYVNDAYISDLEYYVLDTADSADAVTLQNLVGLTVGAGGSSGLNIIGTSSGVGVDNSNRYVTVVGIKYVIPVTYQGVTPLRQIFEYGWRSEADGDLVAGYNGAIGGWNGSSVPNVDRNVEATDHEEYSYVMDGLTNDDRGSVSATGELFYVLVR